MHQAKTYDAYNYFFSKMVSLNKDIANVLAFGTDGEEPLCKAMERNMYHAIHLRCFGHFRDNCKERLCALPREVQRDFLDDVFGRRIDNDSMEAGKLTNNKFVLIYEHNTNLGLFILTLSVWIVWLEISQTLGPLDAYIGTSNVLLWSRSSLLRERALETSCKTNRKLSFLTKLFFFSHWNKGLSDCKTEADFQAQLESLKEVWDEREKAHLPAGKQPSFHEYICEKVTN